MQIQTLIYGGAFDPIHNGHVAALTLICKSKRYDEVWIVPSADKRYDKTTSAPAATRIRWIEKVLSQPEFQDTFIHLERAESDGLIKGEGTFALVEYLKARLPEHRLTFAIGSELVDSLPRWRNATQLAKSIDFLTFSRSGFAAPHVPPEFQVSTIEAGTPLPEVSSTEIRRRIKSGQSVSDLLPEIIAEEVAFCPAYLR